LELADSLPAPIGSLLEHLFQLGILDAIGTGAKACLAVPAGFDKFVLGRYDLVLVHHRFLQPGALPDNIGCCDQFPSATSRILR